MIRFLLLAASFLVAGPVAAENLPLSDQVSRCWTITPAMKDSEFNVKFDVRMDGSGNVTDIAVVSYSPTTAAGRDAVRSASQAIEKCAPYSIDSGPRLHTIRLRWSKGGPVLDKSPGPIDPFKSLSLPKD